MPLFSSVPLLLPISGSVVMLQSKLSPSGSSIKTLNKVVDKGISVEPSRGFSFENSGE